MQRRKLGSQGLEVSALGLGCMGMSWLYGSPDRAESVRTLERALASGVDFFDTAEVYGPYENEKLLGDVLRSRRDQVILATKFGFDIKAGAVVGVNSHPRNIVRVCEESMQRLKTDYIDLFYQHRVDPAIPIEEVVGTMGELVEKGKVRYLGLSEAGPDTLRRAQRTFPISVLQTEYSLWERGLEEKILPVCRELGIGLVPYSPLGRGMLAGQLKNLDELPEGDYRRSDPRYQGENFKKNLKIVGKVQSLSRAYQATAAQVAIAWLLSRGQDVVPIPGTKKSLYLEENLQSLELELSNSHLEELEALSAEVVGARYEASRMLRIEQ